MTFHYERRLDRALYHLKSFEAETAAWREENPHRTWTELDDEVGKKFLWAEIVKSPPDKLGLIAGDCIHNLRAALDNLTFELAVSYRKGRLSSGIERNSGFPILSNDIANDPKSLEEFNRRTGGIDPLAKAEIEALQPYKRGDRFRTDPLWQLNKLSNEDKHRLPHSTHFVHVSSLAFFPPESISIDEVEYLFNTFDSRAPIARYPAFDSTGAEVEMDFAASFDVCFDISAPKTLWLRSIPDALKVIHRHIVNKVLPRLVCFLD
jgi:hypothetical protein